MESIVEYRKSEKALSVHIWLRKKFDSIIKDRYGPDISPDNSPDINLEGTPLYDMYE